MNIYTTSIKALIIGFWT